MSYSLDAAFPVPGNQPSLRDRDVDGDEIQALKRLAKVGRRSATRNRRQMDAGKMARPSLRDGGVDADKVQALKRLAKLSRRSATGNRRGINAGRTQTSR